MSKRFTETTKWQDPWFCSLSARNRIFWIYLLDTCDHAGIWQANWPLVQFYHGSDFSFDKEVFCERVSILTPEKFFIPKFIQFQYGELTPGNRVHDSVLAILRKEGVPEKMWNKVLISPLQGRKDKDKDKDKAKYKDQSKDKATDKDKAFCNGEKSNFSSTVARR